MQATKISGNLLLAIDFLEEVLNKKDGKSVIDSIKKYKEDKKLSKIELENFKID